MISQFNLYSSLRFVFSSFFANIVVIAILAGMLVMTVGLALMCMNQRRGITIVVYGGILLGIFIALAAQQFGAIPVTFDGVAKIGLATFPAGPIMDTYHMATTWLLDKIGWLSSLMLLVGGLMVVSSRNSGVGIQLVLYGVVIGGIGGLIGTGGIVTWIMNYIGVAAPVVA